MAYSNDVLGDLTKHRFNVLLFDKPNGLAERNEHFAEHKRRLAQFKEQHPGVIEFGGPMLDAETHQPIGSAFVLRRGETIPSREAVDRWIEQDAYHVHNVWEKRTVSLFLAMTTPTLPTPNSS